MKAKRFVVGNKILTVKAIAAERHAIEEREQALQERKEQLEQDKDEFKKGKLRAPSGEDIVELNVGGALIATTRSTLCRAPGKS